MSNNDGESTGDSCSDGSDLVFYAEVAVVLKRLHDHMATPPYDHMPTPPRAMQCPIPALTGAQWMERNLFFSWRCNNNLRMSPEAFLHLHDMLLPYGLRSTRECGSKEALGLFIWTCAHGSAVRESQDRFERSLDTISRYVTAVADVMFSGRRQF